MDSVMAVAGVEAAVGAAVLVAVLVAAEVAAGEDMVMDLMGVMGVIHMPIRIL